MDNVRCTLEEGWIYLLLRTDPRCGDYLGELAKKLVVAPNLETKEWDIMKTYTTRFMIQ